jgi:hypothetical protein
MCRVSVERVHSNFKGVTAAARLKNRVLSDYIVPYRLPTAGGRPCRSLCNPVPDTPSFASSS